MEKAGKFITFEGGEGAGKSTQARLLADRLAKHGIATVVTREPGGTQGAEVVRHLLKSGAVKSLGPFAETVMISASRDDHLNAVIRPALIGGKWVICDRFIDSTRAYQGAGAGVDDRLLDALDRAVVGETRPDLTIILDAPPEVGLERAKQRDRQGADRFENERLSFHHRLRSAFLAIAARDAARCVVISSTDPPETVAAAVWEAVVGRLMPHGAPPPIGEPYAPGAKTGGTGKPGRSKTSRTPAKRSSAGSAGHSSSGNKTSSTDTKTSTKKARKPAKSKPAREKV